MKVVYFEDNLTENDRIFWVIHHFSSRWSGHGRILLEDLAGGIYQIETRSMKFAYLPAKSTSFKTGSERLQDNVIRVFQ
ncbi:hypothetical protein CW304_30565 [Bacillus sp. UFRGS-B20]|nr:hypothetical protein CW304_30565 [Bacillus sp. UFRGS-B20]